jgi:bacterioferritin (cytochrome b1)
MQGDPTVIATLNTLFALEVAVFEITHLYEHVMERKRYRRLQKWFDSEVDASRDRRRYITDRCFALDGSLSLTIPTSSVDPNQKTESYLSQTLSMLSSLLTAYQSGYESVEDAGDSVTARKLCKFIGLIQETIADLEAFLGQIEEIGLSAFLAQKLK